MDRTNSRQYMNMVGSSINDERATRISRTIPPRYVVLHFIFSTKERQPLITREIRVDLFAFPQVWDIVFRPFRGLFFPVRYQA